MKVSILTIGDEILNGTTVDTNSTFISKNCIANGLKVVNSYTVSDSYDGIYAGLTSAKENADIVYITGGLGPTKDDITKDALANFFQTDLIFNEAIFAKIEAYFSKGGQKQVDLNKKLAYIPKNATLIPNERGTAQGMWFEFESTIFVSMPGVPHEMKFMLTEHVIPKIKERYSLPIIHNKYIMCAGIGESKIYEKIEDIENELPSEFSLAYLPNLGFVKLRLTYIQDKNKENLESQLSQFQERIIERIQEHVYSLDENKTLAEALGEVLLERKETVSTAESCTGGYISHLLTKTPGSSAYYEGSIIAYSYSIKESILDVKNTTLTKFGAVSEETVIEMCQGLLKTMHSDYAISVSGIAGPGGGMPDKPVGTVWIAVGDKDEIIAKKFLLTQQRDYNIKISGNIALNLLRNFILNKTL